MNLNDCITIYLVLIFGDIIHKKKIVLNEIEFKITL